MMFFLLFVALVSCDTFYPCLLGMINTTSSGNKIVVSEPDSLGRTFGYLSMDDCSLARETPKNRESSPCVVSLDLTNPTNPSIIGKFHTDSIYEVSLGGHMAVSVSGDLLFLPNGTLVILDVKDKRNMKVISSLSLTGCLKVSTVYKPKNSKYLFLGTSCRGNVVIVDITDPTNPIIVSTTFVAVDCVSSMTFFQKNDGKYLVATAGPEIFVLDISNVTNPVVLSETGTIYLIQTSFGGLASNDFYYSLHNPAITEIEVFNISDPKNPKQVVRQTMKDYCDNFQIDFEKRRLYAACKCGITMMDVSDFSHPKWTDGEYPGYDIDGSFNDLVLIEKKGEMFAIVSGENFGAIGFGGLKIFGCLERRKPKKS